MGDCNGCSGSGGCGNSGGYKDGIAGGCLDEEEREGYRGKRFRDIDLGLVARVDERFTVPNPFSPGDRVVTQADEQGCVVRIVRDEVYVELDGRDGMQTRFKHWFLRHKGCGEDLHEGDGDE